MGTVAVLEKGVGLDKTVRRSPSVLYLINLVSCMDTFSLSQLWRLPALLVDDFDEVIELVTFIRIVD